MRRGSFNRTPLIGQYSLIWCLACCVSVLIAPAAAAQDGRLEIEYTVKVADIPGQLFHVTTDIRNINQPALELSLPGHQDLGTTQRYMHLSPAAVDAAIRLLETGTETSRTAVEK